MVNHEATFGRTSWSQPDARKINLPPALLRTRRSQVNANYYSPPYQSQLRVHRIPRRRNQALRVNHKLFVFVPTVAIGLGIARLLLCFLPTFSTATIPQQLPDTSQQLAVPLPSQVNPPANLQLIALRQAIVGKESQEDFQALNPHSQALGLAQILPDNLRNWSQELLGYSLDPEDFLNNPELQLKIIDHKLNEYWQKAIADSDGDEELAVLKVASHWYSGNPNLYKSTLPQRYKGKDGRMHRYPSVAKYSHSVLKKYKQYRENHVLAANS